MGLEVEQFMCRTDNFGILFRDAASGDVGLIDAPEEGPILEAIARTGWTPTVLFVTHHHPDHVEANLALKARFKLKIVGPKAEAAKIPGLDEAVGEGSALTFGGKAVRVIETPGHTAGHVSYWFEDAKIAFTADTLFALGCGRLFEGTAADMLGSLRKLAALPADTAIYCGHEYTLSNARFALTIDPGNRVLQERVAHIEALRAQGKPTLPTTMGVELATNPFLRWDDPEIRKHLGMETASDVEIFAEIRKRKDNA